MQDDIAESVVKELRTHAVQARWPKLEGSKEVTAQWQPQ